MLDSNQKTSVEKGPSDRLSSLVAVGSCDPFLVPTMQMKELSSRTWETVKLNRVKGAAEDCKVCAWIKGKLELSFDQSSQ